MEQTTRKVMVVGHGVNEAAGAGDARLQLIRYPWKEVGEASDLQVWAFNTDGANPLDTGATLHFDFVAQQEWLDD